MFLRHGTPEIFHSDNGTEFKNRVIDSFLAERGVTHTTTPPYHAQANPVERVNRTFKTMLVSFIEGKHSTWDVHIPELMFAYNTAVQESTGMSPAFLNMGRHPAPPNTLRRCEESLAADAEGMKAVQEWRERMERLGDVREKAVNNSLQAQEKQARYYDSRRRDVLYNVGDKVMRRNRVLSDADQSIAAKLAPKYSGPFEIMARLGANVYDLIDEEGNEVAKTHVVDLKPYFEEGKSDDGDATESTPEINETSETRENVTTVDRDNAKERVNEDARERVAVKRKRGIPRKTVLTIRKKKVLIRKPAAMRTIQEVAPETSEDLDEESAIANRRDSNKVESPVVNAPCTIIRKRGRPKGSVKKVEPIREVSPRRTRAQRMQMDCETDA